MASTISRIKRRVADTMEAPAVAINQCIGKINIIIYYLQNISLYTKTYYKKLF